MLLLFQRASELITNTIKNSPDNLYHQSGSSLFLVALAISSQAL